MQKICSKFEFAVEDRREYIEFGGRQAQTMYTMIYLITFL